MSNSIWFSLKSLQRNSYLNTAVYSWTFYCHTVLWVFCPLFSTQEAIPILHLTYKNEKNLFAILAWVVVFSSNRGEEASAHDSYFSQRRGHPYFVQAWVKSSNMYATSKLQQQCMLLLFLPCLDDFKVSVCRTVELAAHWMCLKICSWTNVSWRDRILWHQIFINLLWTVMSVFLKGNISWAAVLIRERFQQGRSTEDDFSFGWSID